MSGGAVFHPAFRVTPYWWDEAPPVSLAPERLPERAEVVVVGGGLAGLNAAITMAQGGAEVLVLDARPFGWGASSRNAGHVSSGINLGKGSSSAVRSPMEAALGAETVAALREEASASFDQLEQRIADLGIDCAYRRSGRFVGAATARHYAGLAAKGRKLSGIGARMVPRDAQAAEIVTEAYHGGMVVERAGQLQPARYLHGLVAAAQRAGARLASDCAVTAAAPEGAGWRLETERGPIACRELLIATNGYTGRLTPWLRRRLAPAASYIVVTEPLPAGTMDRLIPQARTVADTRRLLSYFRPTPDRRRLLFGGRASLRVGDPRRIAPELHRRALSVFPQLAGVRISHAWTGNIGFTFDFLPHLGRHEAGAAGMHYCLGCNGSGVAMLSWLGQRAGRMILGEPAGPFANLGFPTLPLYSGTPWFLPLTTAWYRARDALDQWLG